MKLLKFPLSRQAYEWDCGANALQSVLAYYGVKLREELIIKYAKTNSKEGTSIAKMHHVLKKFELAFDAKQMTIKDLKSYIDRKIPIIILLQAWSGKNTDYSNDFKNGHWVVAIGYDTQKIIFEDPYSFERTCLKNKELAERWHAKEKKDIRVKYGIAVYGKKPTYDPSKIVPME